MATTNTWDQVVEKISGVVNRGAFSKTFTPTTSSQSASGGAGYYSSVSTTCNAVSLSGNAGVGNVLTGKTFYTTSLTKQTGTMANRGNLNWNPSSSTTYSVAAGYYSGGTLNSSGAYNAGVTAADNRTNTNSANYKSGYNAGVTAGKNTMSSTLSLVFCRANWKSDAISSTYTSTSAGYYLAVAVAAGTGCHTGRSASISTTGSKKSGATYWINGSDDEYAYTTTAPTNYKCRHAIAIALIYLNSGNTITLVWDSDYNSSGHAMVFKLG